MLLVKGKGNTLCCEGSFFKEKNWRKADADYMGSGANLKMT
jgi:hypothetical protein